MSSAGGIASPDLSGLSSDLSIQAISEIFGNNWWELASSSPAQGTNAYVIIEMLKQLNELSIFAVTFILAITLASAVVGTAHEGTPLGKNLHSFWVPMRFTLATGMLIPIKAGLCLFQIMILLTVGISIQFANGLWFTFTDVVLEEPLKNFVLPPTNEKSPVRIMASEHVNDMLSNMTYISNLRAEGYRSPNDTMSRKGWVTNLTTSPDGVYTDFYSYQFVNPLSNNDIGMGQLVVKCIDNSPAAQAQCLTLRDELNTAMYHLAPNVVLSVAIGRGLIGPIEKLPTDKIKLIIDDLAEAYNKQTKETIDSNIKELSQDSATFRSNVKALGWVGAGSYYYSISSYLGKTSELLTLPIQTTPSQLSLGDDIKAQRVNIVSTKNKEVTAEAGIDLVDRIKTEGIQAVFPDTGYFVSTAIDLLTKGDPIHAMSWLGHAIISVGNTGVGLWAIANGTIEAATSFSSDSWIGKLTGIFTGGGSNAILAFMKGFFTVFTGLFWLLFTSLYIIGHILAYYLPAVPFIIWTAAVISWLILIVEVIVAAPIWIVGHAMPEGEGFAGQRGAQGYLLLLSILIRPFLMLMGLCIAIVITGGIGKLIGLLFQLYVGEANVNTSGMQATFTSLNTTIAYIVLLGAMMIILTHKTFELITYLPEKILRWIGGGVDNYGEVGEEKEIHNMVAGFATKAGGLATKPNLKKMGDDMNKAKGNANGQAQGEATGTSIAHVNANDLMATDKEGGGSEKVDNSETEKRTEESDLGLGLSDKTEPKPKDVSSYSPYSERRTNQEE